MPYSCDDIRYYLNCDDEESIDMESFSQHLDSCPRCADLCSPGPHIQSLLFAAFAPAAPAGFGDDIMKKLSSAESRPKLVSWLENHPTCIFIGILLAAGAVIYAEWSYLTGAFSSINIHGIFGEAAELAGRIRPQEISLSNIEALIQRTPLVLFTLAAAVMVVWIFSIFEIEKSLK